MATANCSFVSTVIPSSSIRSTDTTWFLRLKDWNLVFRSLLSGSRLTQTGSDHTVDRPGIIFDLAEEARWAVLVAKEEDEEDVVDWETHCDPYFVDDTRLCPVIN